MPLSRPVAPGEKKRSDVVALTPEEGLKDKLKKPKKAVRTREEEDVKVRRMSRVGKICAPFLFTVERTGLVTFNPRLLRRLLSLVRKLLSFHLGSQ